MMVVELFLLSWVVSGAILAVIIFFIEETYSTLGDLILIVVAFMILGWISVIAAIFYYLVVGFCWLCDREMFQIELKKRRGGGGGPIS